MMEMAEKVSEIDQMKGATLEEISSMVEQIGREFKTKQLQLQPMMTELKVCCWRVYIGVAIFMTFIFCFNYVAA